MCVFCVDSLSQADVGYCIPDMPLHRRKPEKTLAEQQASPSLALAADLQSVQRSFRESIDVSSIRFSSRVCSGESCDKSTMYA